MTPPATGSIWAALPAPAFMVGHVDEMECVADCNPAAEQFLSLSRRAVLGRSLGQLMQVDAEIDRALERCRSNRAAVFINDAAVVIGTRKPVICSIQLAPLVDRPELVLMLVTPREIAGKLGQADGIRHAARSAIGMSQMLAHEIKNPLAGITGAAQLLSMGLEPRDRELTDLIVAETQRIVNLLDQVEQFGNQRPPSCRPINIHDILERARRSAEVGFAAHMRIEDAYDPSLPPVWADGDQLLQVFLNLLKNAGQAQPNGGTIRIRTFFEHSLRVRAADGSDIALPIHVEIIDDGPGLPPAIAAEVFDPFVSGRENGTGLGLALVSKIIAAHDGWVSVDSRPGQTVFRVSLPRAPESRDRDDLTEELS
ncbi:two-component system sensor histidine kinase NtrB [Roseibaca sp. Y0-43]|uniref:two-component system sensor histidine kinase NtrB n=1 Tax=Roseibaca sp. Y0-43 TaxID=2816854 RepID=UPI001D0C0426|nr:ATP-binding protein [Roseibaca sp. Y0-43]MCC1482206.1 PAS domain-containing sensor histidine kinase [Roseibaca sp. Y0-43]